MTKEEFEEFVKEFFKWVSPHDKAKTSWLISLENWAKLKYEEAITQE